MPLHARNVNADSRVGFSVTSSTPSPSPKDHRPDPDDRMQGDRNRRFGASLRKLYREALNEPMPKDISDTLDKLK